MKNFVIFAFIVINVFNNFALALPNRRHVLQVKRSLEKRDCGISDYYECSNGLYCCPIGSTCLPGGKCDVPCETGDPPCGVNSCCKKGQYCYLNKCYVTPPSTPTYEPTYESSNTYKPPTNTYEPTTNTYIPSYSSLPSLTYKPTTTYKPPTDRPTYSPTTEDNSSVDDKDLPTYPSNSSPGFPIPTLSSKAGRSVVFDPMSMVALSVLLTLAYWIKLL